MFLWSARLRAWVHVMKTWPSFVQRVADLLVVMIAFLQPLRSYSVCPICIPFCQYKLQYRSFGQRLHFSLEHIVYCWVPRRSGLMNFHLVHYCSRELRFLRHSLSKATIHIKYMSTNVKQGCLTLIRETRIYYVYVLLDLAKKMT